jgi:hypothetical protein
MKFNKAPLICVQILTAFVCKGCGVPYYDVPYDNNHQPTVQTIVGRIECEIRDMVRDDRRNDPATFNGPWLLNGDYDVQVALSLEVTDTGGLAPSFSYATPLSVGTFLNLGASATLSEARDHTFNENIQISVRKIFLDWRDNHRAYDCPVADTNLAGDLGLKDLVAMAGSTANLNEEATLANKGVFGGSIQFVVTKNLTATGPSWNLLRFKNIAALGSLSRVNTDKITLAFAQGPNAGKPMPLKAFAGQYIRYNQAAANFLQQQLISAISLQVIQLQNSPPR